MKWKGCALAYHLLHLPFHLFWKYYPKMWGEKIVLGISGGLLLLLGIRAVFRGRIQLGFKNSEAASLLIFKSPPTERKGPWARVLGVLLMLLGGFFIFAALFGR